MCSYKECQDFLREMGVSKMTSRWLEIGQGWKKEITAHLTNQTKYQVVVSCKKKEDLRIKGAFIGMEGSIVFFEERDGPKTKLSFVADNGAEVLISSERMSIAYACSLGPSGVELQPEKPKWKGPVRSDAREFRRRKPITPKSGIEKIRSPKKPGIYAVK